MYTFPPLPHHFDTDLLQTLPPLFGCPGRQRGSGIVGMFGVPECFRTGTNKQEEKKKDEGWRPTCQKQRLLINETILINKD